MEIMSMSLFSDLDAWQKDQAVQAVRRASDELAGYDANFQTVVHNLRVAIEYCNLLSPEQEKKKRTREKKL